MVALNQAVAKRAAVHRPAVHIGDRLVPRRASARARSSDQTVQAQPALARINHHELLRQLTPKNLPHPIRQARAGRRTEHHPPVLDQGERRLRRGQRVKPHRRHDVRRLGGVGFKKLPPRRHRVKKLRHFDARALRPSVVAHVKDATAIHHDLRAASRACLAGLQGEPGHTRDGRQRLATKPEGRQPVEVARLGNLAGGVSLQRKERILARHAAAVVLNAHERTTAVAKFDLDPRRPGIERILNQLLHHGSRPLHHLARSDLVGNSVWKDADLSHRLK